MIRRIFKKRGFTLIELVVTIVIIGILAAVALPRFFSAKDQAQMAAVNQLAQQIRTALNGVHVAWIAQGAKTGAYCSNIPVQFDDKLINVTCRGWPQYQGIGWNGAYNWTCPTIWNWLIRTNMPEIINSGSCSTSTCYKNTASSNGGNGICKLTLMDTDGQTPTTHIITYYVVTGQVTTS